MKSLENKRLGEAVRRIRTVWTAVCIALAFNVTLNAADSEEQQTAIAIFSIDQPTAPLIQSDSYATLEQSMEDFQTTQSMILQSPFVLHAAMRMANLSNSDLGSESPDPQAWYLEHLKVEFVGGGSLMQVSLEGLEPRDLVMMLDAICKTYMEESQQKRVQQRNSDLLEIEKAYAKMENEIRKLLAEMRSLSQMIGTLDDESQRETFRLQYASQIRLEERLQQRIDDLDLDIGLAQERQQLTRGPRVDDSKNDEARIELMKLERKRLSDMVEARRQKRVKLFDSMAKMNRPIEIEVMRLKLEGKKRLAIELRKAIELLKLEFEQQPRLLLVREAALVEK